MKRILKNERGFTIVEVLIAAFLAVLVAAAGFEFYSTMNNSAHTQQDISDVQSVARNSLDEISRTMRKAGFKTKTHKKFQAYADSLKVYFSESKPMDTVAYYLKEYTTWEYSKIPGHATSVKFYKLMRRVNSEAPAEFSHCIKSIAYTVVDSATIDVTVTALTDRQDAAYETNYGFREFSATQRIHVRNMTL